MSRLTFKKGGIHPDAAKLTAGMPIVALELPRRAVVMLSQHIGAPAKPCVARGAHVDRGDVIGEAASSFSAFVHAPVSGMVREVGAVPGADGYPAPAVIIEADDADHMKDMADRKALYDTLAEPPGCLLSDDIDAQEIADAVRRAGIVGMGGATFPTDIKLHTGHDKPDVLVINACECEPYLTCDDALMRAWPAQIAAGIRLMLRASGASRAVIGIEDNKPEAAAALRAAIGPSWPIEIKVLRTKYPQGGEKQLVQAVTGRRIPSGGLPLSVGVVVNNVATAFAVYMAVERRAPLTDRVITVTGDTPARGNYLVAIGTQFSGMLGDIADGSKVIVGGPMMGRTAVTLDAAVTKGTSGLLVMAGDNRRRAAQPCIRCARCSEVCPMGLEPYLISTYGRLQMFAEARANDVMDCIECGSCSYTCPSARPILDFIRLAKREVGAIIKAEKSMKK